MSDLRKRPEQASINLFIEAIKCHDRIRSIDLHENGHTMRISRRVGDELIVVATNIYCVGECDVREFMAECSEVNTIVTLSAWNMVSQDAKQYGQERRIGVFTWKDFFGALNYRKFWLYEGLPLGLSDQERANERRRRSRAWN